MSVEIIQSPDSREKVIESLVLKGDLSGLTPAQRAAHYNRVCDSLGLNPDSQPFAYLKLNGKEVLYATRGATDQLAAIHRVNREIIDGPKVIDLGGTKIVFCVAKAVHPNGRTETAIATLQFADPINVLMKAETKAKRRATLSILGLGMLDEMEIETIPAAVQQPSVTVSVTTPTLPAPPTWATDLAVCTTLRDVRALYQAAASTERDNRAQCDDVRAWLAEHSIIATAAEVTAILATLPDAALVILDDVHADEEHETTVRIERVARRVARERSAWDAHSAETTAKIVARSYAHATGLDLKAAGAALKRAITDNPDPEPPTGTDGPAREPGSDDGDEASADAWRETAEGIVQHVAGLGARHIENSGRLHLRAVPEALQLHAVHVYGGRLQRLSYDGSSSKPWDECVATVERWLREGPRVTELRPRTRTAAARRAVG